MGRKYNTPYKKGKFKNRSQKAIKADYAKTAYRGLTENYELWKSDPRRYDYAGIDTKRDAPKGTFKYKFRSKKKTGKKLGRENKTYRRYWY